METFYITTPIYYPSNKFTLGNCYTTVICDSIARFNKKLGKDVFFLTGTDEHGQKIAKVASEHGLSEKEYLDGIIEDSKALWQLLDVNYDKFIRTTDEEHIKAGSKSIYQTLWKKVIFINHLIVVYIVFPANHFGPNLNLSMESALIAIER